ADAPGQVGDGGGAGGVRADPVALDQVGVAADYDARGVAGDEVAGPGGGAPTVLCAAVRPICRPTALARAAVPAAFVPIRLPSTRLPLADTSRSTPMPF